MSAMIRFELIFVLVATLGLIVVESAVADCCVLKKLETEPETHVRACAPGEGVECARVLFEGLLRPGEEQTVCTEEGEVLYQEFETEANVFGAMARATCSDNEIEL